MDRKPRAIAGDRLLDRDQVCAKLGIGAWTLAQWVRSGQFPRPIQLTGSTHRWRESAVDAWIAAKEREPHKAPRLRGRVARWESARGRRYRIRMTPEERAGLEDQVASAQAARLQETLVITRHEAAPLPPQVMTITVAPEPKPEHTVLRMTEGKPRTPRPRDRDDLFDLGED